MSINKCFLSGNLTRDAEARTTQSGMSVTQFGMAVNDRVKQGEQWVDRPSFVDCVMFGNRAEKIVCLIARFCDDLISKRG